VETLDAMTWDTDLCNREQEKLSHGIVRDILVAGTIWEIIRIAVNL